MTAQRTGTGGPLSVKVSYLGTGGATVFYTAQDLAGNIITARTADGVQESTQNNGVFTYDQVITVDNFVAIWDEDDGVTATEVVSTRHPVHPPDAPGSVVAVGGDTTATITYTEPDNGGSIITGYTIVGTSSTNSAHSVTLTDIASPTLVTGLTNGDHYTFQVSATNAKGTSAASLVSNMVIPAVVLFAPGPPTSVSAAPAVGSAVVTFTAPASNGGSAITSYTVTAVDETATIRGGQTHTGNSPNTITGLNNGDVYHFTVHATNAIGNSAESVSSNSVTIPSAPGGPVATFTYTQPTSSVLVLDATGSSGTLTWTIDGVAAVAQTTTLTIGPLLVGTHHVRLTAVGTGTAIADKDIDVAWIGAPLWRAQHDAANGSGAVGWWGTPTFASDGTIGGAHAATELPQWSDLHALGPWRNKDCLNMVENYPTAGDGIERIHVYDDNHISLLTKLGDHPSGAGGYRSAMTWNNAYTVPSTYEFAYHGPGSIDAPGNGFPDNAGVGVVRFFRIEFMLPPLPDNKWQTGGGTAYSDGHMRYQNNFFELKAQVGSFPSVCVAPSGDGSLVQWIFIEITSGAQSGPQYLWDYQALRINTWYSYVLEWKEHRDPAIGYVRIYRDMLDGNGFQPIISRGPKINGVSALDSEGRLFHKTCPTDASGNSSAFAFNLENYRTMAILATLPDYPDALIHYRNIRVGPSLASVTQ